MAIVQASELRGLTIDELLLKELELKENFFRLRVQNVMGEVENPQLIKEARRSVAIVKTVMTEKENLA